MLTALLDRCIRSLEYSIVCLKPHVPERQLDGHLDLLRQFDVRRRQAAHDGHRITTLAVLDR